MNARKERSMGLFFSDSNHGLFSSEFLENIAQILVFSENNILSFLFFTGKKEKRPLF
jgi:hypothetical protein